LQAQPTPGTTGGFPSYLDARTEPRTPMLLVAGDAGSPRLAPSTHLVPFDRALVVGRRPPVLDVADGRVWAVRDARVSSVHARIVCAGAGYELHDLGSRNGTWVDGVPVRGPAPLREGAVLFFGLHVAVFRTVTERELAALRREQAAPFGPVPLVSPAFAAVSDRLRRLAPGSGEILLAGETGVGKEVYARAIHEASGRTGRFVAVNCAAVPADLVESELFGHVRGAHSEARENRRGLIEEADGGTLFLDEIGEMSPELQAKLLRFTQDRLVTPLGGTQARRVDLRIVAATNRVELLGGAAGSGLRLDLAVRLGSEPIRLPPLREHVEDVGALAGFFLRHQRGIEPAAFRTLFLHDWPGNVRELEKTLREAEVLSRGAMCVEVEHLPGRIAARRSVAARPGERRPPPSAGELAALLQHHRGNMMRVARELDRQPALVYRWIERFHLDPDTFRSKE
jgi:transcriptional regulator with PAS, ATPase and Fis domain